MLLGESILGAVELGGLDGVETSTFSLTNTLADATLVFTATIEQDASTFTLINTLDDATLRFTAKISQPVAPPVETDHGCITLDEMVDGGVLIFDDAFEGSGLTLDNLITGDNVVTEDEIVENCV